MSTQQFKAEDYHIGIICTQGPEQDVVAAMLDEEHPKPPREPSDTNEYRRGTMYNHNVVITSKASAWYGLDDARDVASTLDRRYPKMKLVLVVGVGSAIARPKEHAGDIRLGDVVVGCVSGAPSLLRYKVEDLAEDTDDEDSADHADGEGPAEDADAKEKPKVSIHIPKHPPTGPPDILVQACNALRQQIAQEGAIYLRHIALLLKNRPEYNDREVPSKCYNRPEHRYEDVLHFNDDLLVARKPRRHPFPPEYLRDESFIAENAAAYLDYPMVFQGPIATGEQRVRKAAVRDEIFNTAFKQHGTTPLCLFRQNGLVTKKWPCLVIRGMCDYADGHGYSNMWENFAAASAAAYAKEVLRVLPHEDWNTYTFTYQNARDSVQMTESQWKLAAYKWGRHPEPPPVETEFAKKYPPDPEWAEDDLSSDTSWGTPPGGTSGGRQRPRQPIRVNWHFFQTLHERH